MDETEDCFHLGVKALIRNDEGKFLLLQVNPIKVKKEVWDLPGGRIQKNESLEGALKREVYEETGLQNLACISPFLMTLTDRRIRVQHHDVGLIFAIYQCDITGQISIRLSEEHVAFGWFAPSHAAELLKFHYPTEVTEKLVKMAMLNLKKL